MNSNYYYAVSALFNGLFAAFVVYYIYLRNKQNPVNRSFMYFGIAVSGWSLIYSLWAFAPDAKLAEFYVRRHMMFEAFIPPTLFHFIAHLTQNFQRLKKWIIAAYLLGLCYSVGMLTPYMIAGVKKAINFDYWPVPGILLPSHVVYFLILITWSFVLLIQRLIRTSGRERQQTFWLFSGMAVGFGGGSINWFLWFDIPIPPTTNFFVGIMFATTAYAMVRHGLMDVDSMVEILRTSRTATLGLLAASLNHELRNPLYVAKGRIDTYFDAVERGVYPEPKMELEKSREILQSALGQLNRAVDIVQRFSEFARPYKVTDAKQEVVIADVVDDVLGFAGHEFERREIKLTEKPVKDMRIHANRRQMEEVLFNLIVNAFQAMKQGGELAIRASQPNGKVIIEVSDTGPGIPEDLQKHIFDPFFSTKGKDGTGLGLYIAKQLVERNGGKIAVKSKLGYGASFTLEFKR